MAPFPKLVEAFERAGVRSVLIGVWGANLYARSGASVFATLDYDLLLPAEADNALRAWEACRSCGLELWLGDEPLGEPRDLYPAKDHSLSRSWGPPSVKPAAAQ